jgi:hypothetical protein
MTNIKIFYSHEHRYVSRAINFICTKRSISSCEGVKGAPPSQEEMRSPFAEAKQKGYNFYHEYPQK